MEIYTLVQDYLAAGNTRPLSSYFDRAKRCYVYSCDDEAERVDIRVHIYRSSENCHSVVMFYKAIGIDPGLLPICLGKCTPMCMVYCIVVPTRPPILAFLTT